MNIKKLSRQIEDLLRLKPFDVSLSEGRSKERYRLIALSSASSFGVKLITSLTGLVTVPLAIDYLGKEQFGLWMVISSLVVWLQLSDFGVINGLTNALSEAHGRDDTKSACGYVSSAFMATLLLAFLCMPLVVLIALWLPWGGILNLQDASLVQLTKDCFLVAGIVFMIGLPVSVVGRVYIAYQLGYVSNLILVFSSLFALVGLAVAVNLELSMPWLVMLVSLGPVVGNILAWGLLHRYLPWCRIKLQSVSRAYLQRVFHSSFPLFLFQIGALLVNQLVNVVVARVGTLSLVADYNILLKIYILIYSLGISLSSPFYPAIREAYERREKAWVSSSIRRVFSVRIGVLIIPALVLIYAGDSLISVWINQPLSENFGVSGWISFMLAMLFSASSATFSEILTSLDNIWPQIKIVFISAVIVLSGMYYLIPAIGLTGIYISVIISTIFPIIWSYAKINRVIIKDMT